MTTTTTVLLPLNNYGPGSFNGSVAVPVGVYHATLIAKRDNWPDIGGDILSLSLDVSYDNGSTWQFLVSATTPGGVPGLPYTKIGTSIPQPLNANRRIRGTVSLGTVISTEIKLETKS